MIKHYKTNNVNYRLLLTRVDNFTFILELIKQNGVETYIYTKKDKLVHDFHFILAGRYSLN